MPLTALQNSWINGVKKDHPRNQMPPGSCWDAVDLILNYGAPLRVRGGWAHHSQDIASVTATASQIRGGVFAVFSTSAGGSSQKCVAVDEDGLVFDATTASSTVLIGTGVTISQNPVFHGGTAASAGTIVYTGLVIIPDATGAAVPKKYDGTTLSDLGGTPPKARRASVYKDFTVLGNGKVGTTEFPNRAWFSPEGDPDVAVSGAVTAWDTTDSWIDFSQPIKGFGATKNALLVFGDSTVSRIRGSTPPPDEDMVVDDPLFQIGLLDPFSIVEHKESIFWCAPEGVFRSDGVVLDDLTKKGGILRHWLDLVKDATSTWTFAAGVIRDHMVITVMDGATFKDCLLVDLQSYAWTRHLNVDAQSFWTGLLNQADELYWGRRGAARVARLSSIFNVGNLTYKLDGDGDAVAGVLETPYYTLGKPGLKRIRRVYVGYETTDYATDNPAVTISYVLTPEETSYTAISPTLAEQTTYKRKRLPVLKRAPGIAFKLAKANAGDFLIHDLTLEQHPLRPARLEQ